MELVPLVWTFKHLDAKVIDIRMNHDGRPILDRRHKRICLREHVDMLRSLRYQQIDFAKQNEKCK